MTSAKRFEDLEVRQRAKELTNLVYKRSSEGELNRDYGLRGQMRRAAVSVCQILPKDLRVRLR